MTAVTFKDALYCIIASELESHLVFDDGDERMGKIESLADEEREKLYWSITESALRKDNLWQTINEMIAIAAEDKLSMMTHA